MKQTNYHLFDFLDFDAELRQNEWLWRACKPTRVEEVNGDVALTVPFQRQKQSGEMSADASAARKEYKLVIRRYGENILRVFAGFGGEAQPPSSEMLAIAPTLKVAPLHVEAHGDEVWVLDERNAPAATVNLKAPQVAWWSDLLPPPDETPDITFYPDGKRRVSLSAYDQFSPPRHDGLALAYTECSCTRAPAQSCRWPTTLPARCSCSTSSRSWTCSSLAATP